MPRLIVKTPAVVLRVRRLGESSKLVSLFSEDYGKLKAVAKGARKPKSKFGAALEVMNQVQVVCYLKPDRDLQTLSDCDPTHSASNLLGDLERLSLGSAACELVERLTLEGEPNKRIYRCLTGVLQGLEEVEPSRAEPLFWYFQIRMAEALGYQPQLEHCAACRQPLSGPWLWFSPAAGGGVCSSCRHPSGHRVAGDSLRFLAGLQQLSAYRADTIPAAPARSGEIRAMLRYFLEYHSSGQGRLKSLDFLESVVG